MLDFVTLVILFILKQAVSEMNLTKDNYNITWMYFPDGRGTLKITLLTTAPDSELKKHTEFSENKVKFELYTRENPDKPKLFEICGLKMKRELKAVNIDLFDKNLPTKILIHGWQGRTDHPIVQKIKEQYLNKGSYNIIAVDWNEIAQRWYFEVVDNVPKIGKVVALLINYLVEDLKLDVKLIHLIGHSLGAHVAGFAGKNSKHRIARITGLDAANPLYAGRDSKERLDETDADFVDVIHTCGNIFGLSIPFGHVDFYPNSGFPPQPGCTGLFSSFACSHGRVHELYAESINSKEGFWAYLCDNYLNFESRKCNNDPILMGSDTPLNARGIYYLKTNSKSPFALGKLNIYQRN